jgi:hypothetical protein
MLKDGDVQRIRYERWPACQKILRQAIEKMEAEMEKTAPSDAAYNLINLLMQHEIFFRKTVAAAIDRDDPDLLGWVRQEWIDWDLLAKP